MHPAKEHTSDSPVGLRSGAGLPVIPSQPPQPAVGPSRDAARQRNRATQRLLRAWMSDESGYDEETWPELKKALEDNRSAAAAESLFSD